MIAQMKINLKSDPKRGGGRARGGREEPHCDLKINKQNLQTGSSSSPIPLAPLSLPHLLFAPQLPLQTFGLKRRCKRPAFAFSYPE